jgi:hypothetical protein
MLISGERSVPGHSFDQRGDIGGQRRTSDAVRVGPPLCDHAHLWRVLDEYARHYLSNEYQAAA